MKSIRMCAWGELGTGKTLSIVYEAMKWKRRNPDAPIYSNIALTVPHVKISDPAVIFDIPDGAIVILDELWLIADSRKATNFVNDIMNMLLIKSRKSGWFVGYTEQHWRQVDLRIRYVTELWLIPRMVDNWLLIKYHDKEGSKLAERVVDASLYWDLYFSAAIPYSLNIEKLKDLWARKNERF